MINILGIGHTLEVQKFELIAATIVGLLALAVIAAGRLPERFPRQVLMGVVVGIGAALVTLAPREDIWPDDTQGLIELLLVLAISGALVALGARRARAR